MLGYYKRKISCFGVWGFGNIPKSITSEVPEGYLNFLYAEKELSSPFGWGGRGGDGVSESLSSFVWDVSNFKGSLEQEEDGWWHQPCWQQCAGESRWTTGHCLAPLHSCSSDDRKGRVRLTDRMNFRKSSKRLLTPPRPSFSESYIALFATKLWQKCVCSYGGTVVYYMILFLMRCM